MATQTLMLPTQEKLHEIYQDLGMAEDKIDVDVQILMEWMRKQSHLPDPEVDERRIRLFLILCKNSLERTKEALDQYYTIKSTVPEFFANRDPTKPELLNSMKTSLFIPLPKLTPEGYRISLSRLRTSEVDNFEFADYVKVNFMSIDIRVSKIDFFKKEIFIFDLDKFTMSHLAAILPQIKNFIYCATTAYPLRIQQVHIINMPSYAQSMVNMVLGFLKKKIASRIMIHNSVADLKKHVNIDILPLDYGGTFPKTSEEITEEWKDELIKHKDWFLAQNSVVCDETRRAKKPNVKVNALAGVEGSFRKLEVD
ncbi:Cellular retinaldehyde binding/alpha-tocopherol transport,CRAL/TRIO, N-terminal domain,CRAL-TRIO lipid [Cinara cedri]|uniref:Cellular retinaldehyde binding/alpha-tocopherol transport,CRAL/TRIO, N-terminal domain,CRAL-TRIO lipid n=1 Tax=Cinara cedri TaxID=506608 RepID=A0A5E4NFB1_9HEMI|nr:Cellular retinaldehyde binding/alpha-tocopherol transport,CRAL/TRIO, N-terminal domain,CRAL-TRIO lipid [Cinara cedri]